MVLVRLRLSICGMLEVKNFITSVKNQGSCGSCVAFGVVATVEGTKRKMSNNPNAKTDYSEAHLFYCHARSEGRHCRNGWWASPALNAFKNKGVVDEACYPYVARDQNCTGLCNDASSRITKITGWREIKNIDGMMTWLSTKGPLVACYTVYSDFFAYKSGIYKRTAGSSRRGGHCVSVVGYNKTQRYWICKNSWGTGWGDKGYFKIAFGQVGIDATMWAVEGVEDTQWYKNTKVQGLWASSHDRNAYAYIQNVGWKKIANNNDNIFFNILTQLAAAKAANRPVNLHIVKGKINQVYVF